MKKTIRVTESELIDIIKNIINEQSINEIERDWRCDICGNELNFFW